MRQFTHRKWGRWQMTDPYISRASFPVCEYIYIYIYMYIHMRQVTNDWSVQITCVISCVWIDALLHVAEFQRPLEPFAHTYTLHTLHTLIHTNRAHTAHIVGHTLHCVHTWECVWMSVIHSHTWGHSHKWGTHCTHSFAHMGNGWLVDSYMSHVTWFLRVPCDMTHSHKTCLI